MRTEAAPGAAVAARCAATIAAALLAAALPAAALLATALPAAAREERAVGTTGELLVLLPDGRGQRRVGTLRLDPDADYMPAADILDLLRGTSYFRNETRKLLLRIGDHRVTLSVDNPFVLIDQRTVRLQAAPRFRAGQVWVPVALFDFLASSGVVPEARWEPEGAILALGAGSERELPPPPAEPGHLRDEGGSPAGTGLDAEPGVRRPAMVVLDPGHGGSEQGTRSTGGLLEKHLTLELAERIRRRLVREAGFRVVLVRERDEQVEVPRRVEIANSSHADLLLSLHVDLGGGEPRAKRCRIVVRDVKREKLVYEEPSRRGPGAVSASGRGDGLTLARWEFSGADDGAESYRLAQELAKALATEFGDGVEVADRPVWSLEGASLPALLVELRAPDGDADRAFRRGDTLDSLTRAIAGGVIAYWGGRWGDEKEAPEPEPDTEGWGGRRRIAPEQGVDG